MIDFLTQAIDDASPELAQAIATAHADIARGVDLRELSTALSAGDLLNVHRVLGMTPDGDDWPQLRAALNVALHGILAPVFDFVALQTVYSHGGRAIDYDTDRAEPDAAFAASLASALAKIITETLAGVAAAIRISMKSPMFGAQEVLAVVGLTAKQVTLYAAVHKAAQQLRATLDKETREDARAKLATAHLATLPAMVAAKLRKKLQQSRGRFGEREARTLLVDLLRSFRAHRFTPLARDQAATIAFTAADAARLLVQRAGLIPSGARKYWQTAGDELVRHSHAQIVELNPDGVPLDGEFLTPFGAPVRHPPVERNCRCRVTLDPP